MDTAQPIAAAETDPIAQLDDAAAAFKSVITGEPDARPRDESGRFASAQPEEEPEAEGEAPEADVDDEDEQEAAEEAQPMPPSWPADQADQWASLPPETQAFLAEREGERERAVNAKFQEAANVRKETLAQQEAANASRTQYAEALETLMQLSAPQKPDPREYGLGTGQYDREAYDLAEYQYHQQAQLFAQLQEQRQFVARQAEQEAQQQFEAWKNEVESEWAPKFIADVPELTDPAKGEPIMRSIVDYAIRSGVPEDVFAEANQHRITSPELHMIWKAMQFDALKAKGTTPAKPKPASPVVRPGVTSTRSSQKTVTRNRAMDRLAREGSVEAAADVFKQFMR